MNHKSYKLFTQGFILVNSLSSVSALKYINYNVVFWRELNMPMSEKFLLHILYFIFKESLKTQLHINHTSHETRVIYFITLDLIIW